MLLARCVRAIQAAGSAGCPSLVRALGTQASTSGVTAAALTSWAPMGQGFAAQPAQQPTQQQDLAVMVKQQWASPGVPLPALIMRPVPMLDLWPEDEMSEPLGDGATAPSPLSCIKRTYQPSVIIRKRRHGWRARNATRSGRNVIIRRRLKGRWKLTA